MIISNSLWLEHRLVELRVDCTKLYSLLEMELFQDCYDADKGRFVGHRDQAEECLGEGVLPKSFYINQTHANRGRCQPVPREATILI